MTSFFYSILYNFPVQVTYGPESEISSTEPHLIHAGPSYLTQTQGVLELVKAYQWKYISVVQSDGNTYFQGEFLMLFNMFFYYLQG